LVANLANAQKSTGPKTEEGRKRSALNAVRHGLTGQVVVMPGEDLEVYRKFCTNLMAKFDLDGAHETCIGQSIADDYWRLNRVKALEDAVFAAGHLIEAKVDAGHMQINNAIGNAQTFMEEGKSFQLITLYESRINRNIKTKMAQLKEIQDLR